LKFYAYCTVTVGKDRKYLQAHLKKALLAKAHLEKTPLAKTCIQHCFVYLIYTSKDYLAISSMCVPYVYFDVHDVVVDEDEKEDEVDDDTHQLTAKNDA